MTHTKMLVSGAGGRCDLSQAQSTLDGGLMYSPQTNKHALASSRGSKLYRGLLWIWPAVGSPYQVQGTCGLLVRAETKLSPGTP